MSDWETFATEAKQDRPSKGGACLVGATLAGLDEDAQVAVRAALADPTITSSAIARALEARIQIVVPRNTIARHRRSECACDRNMQ